MKSYLKRKIKRIIIIHVSRNYNYLKTIPPIKLNLHTIGALFIIGVGSIITGTLMPDVLQRINSVRNLPEKIIVIYGVAYLLVGILLLTRKKLATTTTRPRSTRHPKPAECTSPEQALWLGPTLRAVSGAAAAVADGRW